MATQHRVQMTVYAEQSQLRVVEGLPEQHHLDASKAKKFVIKYPQEEITLWVAHGVSIQEAAGALSNMLRARRASVGK